MKATPHTVLARSFRNFAGVLFYQGLKMCMTFCCNHHINFCPFFRNSDLVILGLKTFRHWVSCERNSSYSFSQIVWNVASVFLKVWRCAWRFAVNYFCHLFTHWTWSFWGLKHLDTGYLVNATPPTVLATSSETLQVFLSRSANVHDV